MQSVAAQYGVLPAAQRELPWPEWSVLVAGLMDDTPLGRLAAVRLQRDPAALRRMEAEREPAYRAAADAVIDNTARPEDAVRAAAEAFEKVFDPLD